MTHDEATTLVAEVNYYQEQLLQRHEADAVPSVVTFRAWAENQANILVRLSADKTLQLAYDTGTQRYFLHAEEPESLSEPEQPPTFPTEQE